MSENATNELNDHLTAVHDIFVALSDLNTDSLEYQHALQEIEKLLTACMELEKLLENLDKEQK